VLQSLLAAVEKIVTATPLLLECDRASLFIAEPQRDGSVRLTVKASNIMLPIEISVSEGITGLCYRSGEVINIPDVYHDERFNPEVDNRTGYRTRSLLTIPVKDESNRTLAVFQAINKRSSADNADEFIAFDESDEAFALYICDQLGLVLRNIVLMEGMRIANARAQGMVEIVKSIHGKLGVNSILYTLGQKVPALVDATRCIVYLYDRTHEELLSLSGDEHIRVSVRESPAGRAALDGKAYVIADPAADPEFTAQARRRPSLRGTPKNMLCVPIFSADREVVIGVLQVESKRTGDFDQEDEELLETFLMIVGPYLERSSLFIHAREEQQTEFGRAAALSPRATRPVDIPLEPTIVEGDEEEEDEGQNV
jgi:GAF domain-containing protein